LLDTAIHIHRILHYLLKRFNDSEDRFILMQNAISKASKSIYTIVHELQEQVREHSEESDTFLPLEFRDFLPDQLASLQKLAVNQIQNWANTSRLQDHPQILSILNAWRDWGDADACRKYVKQLTDTDRGLIAFLTAALNPAINESMSDYEKNPLWETYLTEIDSFISVKKLEQHAKELFEDPYFEKLREKEQLALMIFLDLIKAKTRKDIPGTSV